MFVRVRVSVFRSSVLISSSGAFTLPLCSKLLDQRCGIDHPSQLVPLLHKSPVQIVQGQESDQATSGVAENIVRSYPKNSLTLQRSFPLCLHLATSTWDSATPTAGKLVSAESLFGALNGSEWELIFRRQLGVS